MYTVLATKLAVPTTGSVSQAVSMDSANSVQIDATLFVKGGGNFTVSLEGSNDLENWTAIGSSTITYSAVGYQDLKVTAIAYRYVRLSYTQASSGPGIVAAGIKTAQL